MVLASKQRERRKSGEAIHCRQGRMGAPAIGATASLSNAIANSTFRLNYSPTFVSSNFSPFSRVFYNCRLSVPPPKCRLPPPRTITSTRRSRVPVPSVPFSLVQPLAPSRLVSLACPATSVTHCQQHQGGFRNRIALTTNKQPSHILQSVRNRRPDDYYSIATDTHLLTLRDSRQDSHPAQPQVSRGPEAPMAALWQAVVCRLHDSDYRQLGQGGHSYGFPDVSRERKQEQALNKTWDRIRRI